MGNWRTVEIIGTCDALEVEALRNVVNIGWDSSKEWHALAHLGDAPTLCGLDDWVSENINVVGNCGFDDCDVTCVVEALKFLVKVAPSLELKVHCGGDYESHDVVATITVKDCTVTLGSPEKKSLRETSEEEDLARVLRILEV